MAVSKPSQRFAYKPWFGEACSLGPWGSSRRPALRAACGRRVPGLFKFIPKSLRTLTGNGGKNTGEMGAYNTTGGRGWEKNHDLASSRHRASENDNPNWALHWPTGRVCLVFCGRRLSRGTLPVPGQGPAEALCPIPSSWPPRAPTCLCWTPPPAGPPRPPGLHPLLLRVPPSDTGTGGWLHKGVPETAADRRTLSLTVAHELPS